MPERPEVSDLIIRTGRQDDTAGIAVYEGNDAFPKVRLRGDGVYTGDGTAEPDTPLPTGLDPEFTGALTVSQKFGVGAFTPTVRLPFATNMVLAGDSVGVVNTDVVGHTLQTGFSGDFTSMGGPNPGVIFGLNVFTYTSPTNDIDGVTSMVGGLVEMSVRSGAGTSIPMVRGFQAEAAFFGASAAAHVDTIESLRVSVPKRKDGAIAGDADVVRTLYVEATPAGTLGSDEAYAVFVESGLTHFGGKVEIELQDAAEIGLRIRGFTSQTANLLEGYTVADLRTFRLSAAGLVGASSSVIAAEGTAQVTMGAHGPSAEAAVLLGATGAVTDTTLGYRAAATIVRHPSFHQFTQALTLLETTDPAAPSANRGALYVRDNGSGKTQLCIRFNTGAIQVLSTEP